MVAGELRRWLRARRATAAAHAMAREPGHAHDHDHDDGHIDDHAHGFDHDHGHAGAGRGYEHPQSHDAPALEHAHGPVRHTHLPAGGARVTRRGLFVLGLAGGLVPSANALLILLATVAAGRPAWGVVLVAAFGLGMAGVMAGVGLAVVYGRGAIERLSVRRPARLAALVPTTAALVVLVFGLVLTSGALAKASIR